MAYQRKTTTLDITVDLSNSGDGVKGFLVYRKALFQKEDIRAPILVGNFTIFLSVPKKTFLKFFNFLKMLE